MNFDTILLLNEQKELLLYLVAEHSRVVSTGRGEFFFKQSLGGSFVIHTGLPDSKREVSPSSLHELQRQDLIWFTSEIIFYITPLGVSYAQHLEKLKIEGNRTMESANSNDSPNQQTVFVVHGRNSKARQAIFDFLRSIHLQPLEWETAVELTGKASPSTMEVIVAGMSAARAVIVLLTGDDLAKLRPEFHAPDEPGYETNYTPQARPNVIFEAGMAYSINPDRTLLVKMGRVREFSDISGINFINFNGDPASRNALASRLRTAKCELNTSGSDWLKAGNFDFLLDNSPVTQDADTVPLDSTVTRLDNKQIQISWSYLMSHAEIERGQERFRRVPKVGEIFISQEDIQQAEECGPACSVILFDMETMSSAVPQYMVNQFLP